MQIPVDILVLVRELAEVPAVGWLVSWPHRTEYPSLGRFGCLCSLSFAVCLSPSFSPKTSGPRPRSSAQSRDVYELELVDGQSHLHTEPIQILAPVVEQPPSKTQCAGHGQSQDGP
jgi:hypothetical protein